MKWRVLTSAILVGILGGVCWLNLTEVALALFGMMAALAQWEVYTLLRRDGRKPFILLGLFVGLLVLLEPYWAGLSAPGFSLFKALGLGLALVYCGLFFERAAHQKPLPFWIFPTLMGVIWVPFLLHFHVRLWMQWGMGPQNSLLGLIWIWVSTKICDVGALLCGKKWGRHKLWSAISPHKTWEGVMGGLSASAILCASWAGLFPQHLPSGATWGKAAVIGGVLGAVAVVSDLSESAFKRLCAAKDSGRVLPGIGGALDLMDSLLWAGPAAYLLCQLLEIGV